VMRIADAHPRSRSPTHSRLSKFGLNQSSVTTFPRDREGEWERTSGKSGAGARPTETRGQLKPW